VGREGGGGTKSAVALSSLSSIDFIVCAFV